MLTKIRELSREGGDIGLYITLVSKDILFSGLKSFGIDFWLVG